MMKRSSTKYRHLGKTICGGCALFLLGVLAVTHVFTTKHIVNEKILTVLPGWLCKTDSSLGEAFSIVESERSSPVHSTDKEEFSFLLFENGNDAFCFLERQWTRFLTVLAIKDDGVMVVRNLTVEEMNEYLDSDCVNSLNSKKCSVDELKELLVSEQLLFNEYERFVWDEESFAGFKTKRERFSPENSNTLVLEKAVCLVLYDTAIVSDIDRVVRMLNLHGINKVFFIFKTCHDEALEKLPFVLIFKKSADYQRAT